MSMLPTVYVTIHYQCGHDACRPVRQSADAPRERWSYDRCQRCEELLQSRYGLRKYAEREESEKTA